MASRSWGELAGGFVKLALGMWVSRENWPLGGAKMICMVRLGGLRRNIGQSANSAFAREPPVENGLILGISVSGNSAAMAPEAVVVA